MKADITEAACVLLCVGVLHSNRADSKNSFIADIFMIKYIEGDLEGLLHGGIWCSKASVELAAAKITCLVQGRDLARA